MYGTFPVIPFQLLGVAGSILELICYTLCYVDAGFHPELREL
jgi:hypothetical protein